MKKLLPILLVTSLLLSACSIDWGDEKIPPTENINKQVELKDAFQKKQECLKYKDEMKEDLKKRFTGVFDEYALKEEYLTINDIFYSPVQNSCFYKGEHSMGGGKSNYVIVDFLSNKVIYHSFFSCGLAPENNYITTKQEMQKKCSDETEKRIKQLKGEIPVDNNINLSDSDKAYEEFKRMNP